MMWPTVCMLVDRTSPNMQLLPKLFHKPTTTMPFILIVLKNIYLNKSNEQRF